MALGQTTGSCIFLTLLISTTTISAQGRLHYVLELPTEVTMTEEARQMEARAESPRFRPRTRSVGDHECRSQAELRDRAGQVRLARRSETGRWDRLERHARPSAGA